MIEASGGLGGGDGRDLATSLPVNRRLAQKNVRTAMIAAVISVLVFGASFLAAFVYLAAN